MRALAAPARGRACPRKMSAMPPRTTRALLALALALLVAAAQAQSYEWRDVVQVVTIEPSGDVIVDDTRTLWTDDDFGEAFICLELEEGQRVDLLPGSGAVSSGPPATAFTQPCSAGTELVVRNQERVSERRVRFHYRLSGTMEFFSDVAQWYWNLIQLDHPPIVGYRLTVEAPGPMEEPYDAFVHRYANPERPVVTLSPDRSVLTVTLERIPPGAGVEVDYLMDPDLFEPRGRMPGMEQALIEEAEIAGISEGLAARAALRRSAWWTLLPAAIVAFLLVGVVRAYVRHGQEPDVAVMRYPFEPPSDLPPAAVVAMLTQSFQPGLMGNAFMATIMDLARRGYGEFTSRRGRFEMRLDLQRSTEGLQPFEADVLRYLKNAAMTYRRGDPSQLEFREMRSYSQRYASSFMQRWGKSVRQWVEAKRGGPLVNAESQRVANAWAARAIGGMLVCIVVAAAAAGPGRVAGIAGAVGSLALAVTSAVAVPRWRPEIAAEVAAWKGFKRTLSDYTRMKDAPDDFFKLWDVYYVYAAALGVAEKFLKNLARAAPLRGIDERTVASRATWIGSTSSLHSLSDVSRSVMSLSRSLSAASATASSGGSSSGGGGGGGGGGSSGGR